MSLQRIIGIDETTTRQTYTWSRLPSRNHHRNTGSRFCGGCVRGSTHMGMTETSGLSDDEKINPEVYRIEDGHAWKESAFPTLRESGKCALCGAIGDFHLQAMTKCPRCGSPEPRKHPAIRFEGEVVICPNPFHNQSKP